MKATQSLDGIKRVNMQITFRMSADNFADTLCLIHRYNEGLPALSAAQIERLVRRQLKENADAPYWWRDDIDDDDAEMLWQWATELVRRHFPELH